MSTCLQSDEVQEMPMFAYHSFHIKKEAEDNSPAPSLV